MVSEYEFGLATVGGMTSASSSPPVAASTGFVYEIRLPPGVSTDRSMSSVPNHDKENNNCPTHLNRKQTPRPLPRAPQKSSLQHSISFSPTTQAVGMLVSEGMIDWVGIQEGIVLGPADSDGRNEGSWEGVAEGFSEGE